MKEVYDTETGMVTVSDGEREAVVTITELAACRQTLDYDSAYLAAGVRLLTEHTIRKVLEKHAAQEETE